MLRIDIPEDTTRTVTITNQTGRFLTDMDDGAFQKAIWDTSHQVLDDLQPCPDMESLLWSVIIHQAVNTITTIRRVLLCNMKDGKVCVQAAPSEPDAGSGETGPRVVGLPSSVKLRGATRTGKGAPSSGSPGDS